jgi:hypothetical protein
MRQMQGTGQQMMWQGKNFWGADVDADLFQRSQDTCMLQRSKTDKWLHWQLWDLIQETSQACVDLVYDTHDRRALPHCCKQTPKRDIQHCHLAVYCLCACA